MAEDPAIGRMREPSGVGWICLRSGSFQAHQLSEERARRPLSRSLPDRALAESRSSMQADRRSLGNSPPEEQVAGERSSRAAPQRQIFAGRSAAEGASSRGQMAAHVASRARNRFCGRARAQAKNPQAGPAGSRVCHPACRLASAGREQIVPLGEGSAEASPHVAASLRPLTAGCAHKRGIPLPGGGNSHVPVVPAHRFSTLKHPSSSPSNAIYN